MITKKLYKYTGTFGTELVGEPDYKRKFQQNCIKFIVTIFSLIKIFFRALSSQWSEKHCFSNLLFGFQKWTKINVQNRKPNFPFFAQK